MPRYYRRRYSRRTFRKRNWSSNVITSSSSFTLPSSSTYGAGSAICLNPVQTVTTVSQPFTVKNVKLSISLISSSTNAVQNAIVALCYVPQGYSVTYATLQEHPEWLMAVKYIGEPEVGTRQDYDNMKPFQVSTRLARKLQTGDSVQLCMFAKNNTKQQQTINLKFMAQWWTCAN
ncbi:hypothetical protein [Cirilivirus boffger]|uniref:Uncharacterized protein n=1 Tax=Circular ssDNA virus sp. TaxID=2805939 RepID=A0A1W5PVL7_9VIRU|nr:hypothetical protein [Circular ssDNA virus sp.]